MSGPPVNTVALAAVVLSWGLAACAEPEEGAMCPAYAQFVGTYEIVASADPSGAAAAEVVVAVETARGELRQLRSVADERYSAPIDGLDDLLDDLRRTLDSLQDEDDYETWAPLVTETVDDVEVAYDRLRRVMDPVCEDRIEDAAAPNLAAVDQEEPWTAH